MAALDRHLAIVLASWGVLLVRWSAAGGDLTQRGPPARPAGTLLRQRWEVVGLAELDRPRVGLAAPGVSVPQEAEVDAGEPEREQQRVFASPKKAAAFARGRSEFESTWLGSAMRWRGEPVDGHATRLEADRHLSPVTHSLILVHQKEAAWRELT